MNSTAFVRKMFDDYYSAFFPSKPFPLIEKREFGFVSFDGWMLRHKSFQNEDQLTRYLQDNVPRDAFFSCAYYENPEAEMVAKGWDGADLIFDVDADHLSTPCDKIHDDWVCSKCGFAGKGVSPEKCPVCNSEKFDAHTWPCERCVDSAKGEIIKLLEMLTSDFGFSNKEVRVFFSGHRGYHVHVENDAVRTLDSVARKEIVDYIYGLGLDVALHGFDWKDSNALKMLKNLRLNDSGWRGRIAKSIYQFISFAKEEDYKRIGLEKSIIGAIMNNKHTILRNWGVDGPWGVVKRVGPETWKKIAEHCAKVQSANVDTVVTTDIHRLIRLAGTLHGKTGLKKIEFSTSKIEDFDPFKSAVAFKNGSATVFVHSAPEFRLGEETFGPYKNKKVELPIAATLLLVCKGRAEVMNCNV